MIRTSDRETAVNLIKEAVSAGARRTMACDELQISERTFRRWTKGNQIRVDQRPIVPRPEPANKLSACERAAVLEVCNSVEFASLPCLSSKLSACQGDLLMLINILIFCLNSESMVS